MAYNTLARHIRSSIVCIVHLHNEEAKNIPMAECKMHHAITIIYYYLMYKIT